MQQKLSASARRTVREKSLRTTLFFETFFLLVLTVCTVSVTIFFLSRNELKIRSTSELLSIADGKKLLLEEVVQKQRETIAMLAKDPTLQGMESLTEISGWQRLMRIDENGVIKILIGESTFTPLSDEMLQMFVDTDATLFYPIVTDEGWTAYVIAAPQMNGERRISTLIAVFDAASLTGRMFRTENAAKTTEVLLVIPMGLEDILFRFNMTSNRVVPVREIVDKKHQAILSKLPNFEGMTNATDYAGIPVLAVRRFVPALGWSVIVKMDEYEMRASAFRLAIFEAGIGLLLVAFLSLSTFFLARRIVGPIEELTRKLEGLESKRWTFRRSIFTGNELEVVDGAADDLAKRLQKAHYYLENAVRKRTKELAAELARNAAILQSIDDGLIVTNEKGVVTYMNDTAVLLTGFTEVVGEKAVNVLKILSKDGQGIDSQHHPIHEVLSKKTSFHPFVDPQLSIMRKDGKQTAMQIRTTPIMKGVVCLGTVTVIRDVTEERKIDHLKSEFISLVSHQLRTPLSSMRWYLEMLLSEDAGPLTDGQKDSVTQAGASNARMVHLINALLNVSKIELGAFHVSAEPIDVGALVRTTALSFNLECKEKNITLTLDLPQNPVSIHSDKNLIALITENFISNALKYSQSGSVVIVTLQKHEKAGTVTLSVADAGIGIPALEQAQIGQKLFRGTNAKTLDTDGNGLGLYLSRVAAETIGGTLTFESTEGKGSTFSLKIPIQPKILQS